jgi:serine/threonine protein kinase/sugar lactone lactonase YvrE
VPWETATLPIPQTHQRIGRYNQMHKAGESGLGAPESGEDSQAPGNHERIGRYRLLQKLGEGGCGIVYMAEQEEPVRRVVALKVIKPGMDTKQVLARFEAERQALALMDHPNIARVLDAGATDSAHPYFVMELVHGVKITDYCDENNLSTAQRLELFIQVCRAIQHAHQKGIIHRDIKPSNILVRLDDGKPVPKVIDFGIAKATEQRLTDRTLFTAFEQFIGTLAYMSPEQIRLSGLNIDTRSDIYSLGVVLYELMTGQVPFDPQRLGEAGIEEVCRVLREEDPPRPSVRISDLPEPEQAGIARRRQSDPPKLVARLRADLDWIVVKTLEKDRNRRYQSANDLASDIERHLRHEAVLARPPTRLYILTKAFRRHKIAFIAGALVIGSLVLGVGLAAWMYLRERATRRLREVEAQNATELARFASIKISGYDGSMPPRLKKVMRDILEPPPSERKVADKHLTAQSDPGHGARFTGPRGIAIDRHGILYVTDQPSHTIRKVTSGGIVTTLAGHPGPPGSTDGTGTTARFNLPCGIVVDVQGNLYVTDEGNHTIRKVTRDGVVSTLAGLATQSGSADGLGSNARFRGPEGVALDSAANLYVADNSNHTIRKITPAGEVSTLAGAAASSGTADGTLSTARFRLPGALALDPAGNIYVCDVSQSTVRRITPAGEVTTFAGRPDNGFRDGTGSDARFYHPFGVALDAEGNLYVADRANSIIRQVTPNRVVTTIAGAPSEPGDEDGPGPVARFYFPEALAVDADGNIFVVDAYNYTIRRISARDHIVTTVAGVAGEAGIEDSALGLNASSQPK